MSNVKRPNNTDRERVLITLDHPDVTADATFGFYKVPADKTLEVTRVTYVNWTGLAVDNTNAFAGYLKNGATVMATAFNTDGNDSPAGATLTANTFVAGTLSSTPADLWAAANATLTFLADEDGDTTLPAGRLIVEGYLY